MATEPKPKADVVESAPKSKAIQISTATTNTGQVILFALCDDGTIHMTRPTSPEYGWAPVKKL